MEIKVCGQYNFFLYRDFENDNKVPIEMHKYVFDAYRLMPDELRQSFYTEFISSKLYQNTISCPLLTGKMLHWTSSFKHPVN